MKELINLFNVYNLLFNNTFLFLEGCFIKLIVKIGNWMHALFYLTNYKNVLLVNIELISL